MGRQQEYKVQLRGGFADREGFGKINKTIQYDDLDERSRNALFNLFGSSVVSVGKKYRFS